MPVSSFIVTSYESREDEVLSLLTEIKQYTVLGKEENRFAVLAETGSFEEEYEQGKRLADHDGIREINILFHNFEDVVGSKEGQQVVLEALS